MSSQTLAFMKIALTFPGCHRRGGVERIVLECANFLAERGHETHLLVGEWDADLLNKQVIVHPVEFKGRMPLGDLKAYVNSAPEVLRELGNQIDVVAAHNVVSPFGVCWVHSVHAAWLEASSQRRGFSGRLRQKLNPFHSYVIGLEKTVFQGRNYKKLIAMTPQIREDLKRFYNVPFEDVVIMPNGFAPKEFNIESRNQKRDSMRQKLGFKPSDRVIIFVANELERKGFKPLLDALTSLKRDDVHLLAVGKLDAQAYATEIEKAGWKERVQFTGPTSNVADYYAASDVFALPTQYEAWGLVIVEALACGVPVLTSALAGAAVAVREGDDTNRTGTLLQNPDDVSEIAKKIVPLLEGKHASHAEISESVAQYAWNKVLLDYEKLLIQCAKT